MNFVTTKQRNEARMQRPRLMQAEDLVIVYERHDSLDHFYLKQGGIFRNKFGSFYHNDIIGKPFGTKFQSRGANGGYVYLLEPTPELWSAAIHTRTQIVNELDSSFVTMMLDVYPGCTVVESGTGSGCMTLSLARAVYPQGHVYTFEYNEVRAEKAKEEFKKFKVDDIVTVTHKDVCGKYKSDGTGGGFPGVADGQADSVFLDLPEPWLAIEHAKRVLKPGRNICCYSPCIEQVMKTCDKLRELNFHSIRMVEVRQRPFDARTLDMETIDLGFDTREEEMTNDRSLRDPSCSKQTYKDGTPKNSIESVSTKELPIEPVSKKQRVDGDIDLASPGADATGQQNKDDPEIKERSKQNKPTASINGSYQMHVARPLFQMKGHTAFLTFALRSIE